MNQYPSSKDLSSKSAKFNRKGINAIPIASALCFLFQHFDPFSPCYFIQLSTTKQYLTGGKETLLERFGLVLNLLL
jgi:hypothetical protein